MTSICLILKWCQPWIWFTPPSCKMNRVYVLDGIKVAFVFQEGLLRTDATSAVRGNVEVCRCRYHAHLQRVVTVWKDEMGLNPSNTWTANCPMAVCHQSPDRTLERPRVAAVNGICLTSSVFPAVLSTASSPLTGELDPASVLSVVQWWWNLAHFDPMWNDTNIWAAALQSPPLFLNF